MNWRRERGNFWDRLSVKNIQFQLIKNSKKVFGSNQQDTWKKQEGAEIWWAWSIGDDQNDRKKKGVEKNFRMKKSQSISQKAAFGVGKKGRVFPINKL